MKRWSWIVAGLYMWVVVLLAGPVVYLAFAPGARLGKMQEMYSELLRSAGAWAVLGTLGLCQAALLLVPVAVASGRPVRRRRLFLPVLAAGLMAGLLLFAGLLAVIEFANSALPSDSLGWAAFAAGAATWIGWTVWFMTRREGAVDVYGRQVRLLKKGSIAELLVAVPAHVIVRNRDECCAGAWTFIGLSAGIAVLLFAFGPAAFVLFARRARRLRAGAARVSRG